MGPAEGEHPLLQSAAAACTPRGPKRPENSPVDYFQRRPSGSPGQENFRRERRRPDEIFFPYALAAREGRMARQARAKGGAEQSVSPVGCSPKAKARRRPSEQSVMQSGSDSRTLLRTAARGKAMRKRGEQGSAGHGSDLRDHCEPDRANEVSSSHGGDASPRP